MSGYAALLVAGGVGAAVIAALYTVAVVGGLDAQPLRVAPFQSGQWPAEHAVSRFHARWYAVAVLFLAFDIEMLFMYPWALVVAGAGTGAVVEMFAFLAVLLVGVGYARREGALRWA